MLWLLFNFLRNNYPRDFHVSIYYWAIFFRQSVLTQPEKQIEKRLNQTKSVYGKLNFYRRIKGLCHISTNVTRLLIIKQGHRPMFTTRRQEASREWVMMENDFYAPKPLLTEVSSQHFFSSAIGNCPHCIIEWKKIKFQRSMQYIISFFFN